MSRHQLAGGGLCCVRDDRVLFEGLGFAVNDGEALLLEGDNGSGKTSLLRIICGFREPDAGAVTWCGAAIGGGDYYHHMAYVGHLDGIKKELTVLENLRVARALARTAGGAVAEALATVQLQGYEDAPALSLSAGQRRRLALARLLVANKRLWVLDEPFTALDRQGIALAERLLRGHCAGGGLAVLTSHHEVGLDGVNLHRIRL